MTSDVESDYDRMGRTWLGLGNLDANCWFIGMEPGGDAASDAAWAAEWAAKFESAPTVDLHRSATAKELRYIGPNNVPHPTWSPLVRFRLAYAGENSDDASVLAYQREHFAKANGREALLEVSAYASKNTSLPSPRKKYLKERIELLSSRLKAHRPEIALFYSTTYRAHYEKICGTFDSEGFIWSGSTLCALTLHPYQQYGKSPPPEFWVDLAHEMRRRIAEVYRKSRPDA